MKTPLITRKGYLKLKQELDFLWREERPEITRKVTWAASLGDRSENADYQYNKKKLREIDRRVRYLRKCLENLKVVDYDSQQRDAALSGHFANSFSLQLFSIPTFCLLLFLYPGHFFNAFHVIRPFFQGEVFFILTYHLMDDLFTPLL
ncbi:hypothetical protein [Alteromonas abrolhosensis]|uniref:hypothetical protein n=1 Tax=Alteromonas abrolhosensis TaxID=1892904 RepID=UPI003BAB260D